MSFYVFISPTLRYEVIVRRMHRLVIALSTQSKDEGLQHLGLHGNVHRLCFSMDASRYHDIINGRDEVEKQREEILTLFQLQSTQSGAVTLKSMSIPRQFLRPEQKILYWS